MPRQRPLLGVALIVLMAACFAGMDTIVRHLDGRIPVLLMLGLRYGLQAGLMALFLLLAPRQGFATAHPRFQALRGSLLLCSSAMAFIGLQYIPVAEYTAISMLTPVLVTLLAAVLLHEAVSAGRWALVGGALLGALVVIRPGSGLFGWAVLFPLTGALAYASFQVLTRRLSAVENPYTTHFYTGQTGILLVLPMLLVSGIDVAATVRAISPSDAALMVVVGLLGTLGHLLLVLALGMAPTATLMPFTYSQIALATGLAWWVFGRLPDGWAWLGMAIITGCGAASAWLNVRRRPVSGQGADDTGAAAAP